MTTNPSTPVDLANVRGSRLLPCDTREVYRQRLALITLDSMVQFVGLLDAQGIVLEINHGALEAVGITLADVEGKPFWSTFWWQVSDKVIRTLKESIERASQGEFVRWDAEVYGRAGGKETIIIDASLMPVKDERGNVRFITAEGRDITEKKAHEREISRQREELAKLDQLARNTLAENEKRFRALVTATSYSIYKMNPDWTEMYSLTGDGFLSGVDGPNRAWLEQYIHPDDQQQVAQAVKEAIQTKSIFKLEHRARRNDGSFGWTLSRAVPMVDESGRITEWFGTASDISDRKRSDESRFRLAAIVDSADDAIVSKDLNGIVLSWNEGARRMFGYSADDMIGQSILRLIPKELQYEEEEILNKLRAGERIDHYETRRTKKSGESIDVSVTISPIKDESGRVLGASKVARDISDRKRVERLLVQSEKLAATGRMAAAIAHEINNPLEAVLNLIFLARQSSPAGGKAHGYLLTAEGELERVSHIARQTLGYYRDTGSPNEVYLYELIENVLTVYNSKLLAAGILTDLQFNDSQKIIVSKDEILQVFSNIIANAIDAMRQGGILHISTERLVASGKEGIQITIQDNGMGIRADHLHQVFEPFFTTKGDMGTGIGLWVAKQLVETRGGRISIASSTKEGCRGTNVTIFIPIALPLSHVQFHEGAGMIKPP